MNRVKRESELVHMLREWMWDLHKLGRSLSKDAMDRAEEAAVVAIERGASDRAAFAAARQVF